MGRQLLINLNSLVEVVHNLLLWQIVRVAIWLQGADASAVLVPLMLPQIVIITTEILPILAHVFEQVSPARVNKDQRNVAVLASGVTELVKAAVAVIGPTRVSCIFIQPENVVQTHHSPWIVHASSGPSAGSTSQNCVCSI